MVGKNHGRQFETGGRGWTNHQAKVIQRCLISKLWAERIIARCIGTHGLRRHQAEEQIPRRK